MPDGAGVPFLARVLARTKYPKIRKKIDKALNEAAEAAGGSSEPEYSEEEVEFSATEED